MLTSFPLIINSHSKEFVLVQAAIINTTDQGGLNNRHLFFTVLEAAKSKIDPTFSFQAQDPENDMAGPASAQTSVFARLAP